MFHKIFIEAQLKENPQIKSLLKRYPKTEVQPIDRIEHYFGKVKKPYLQKRDSLHLYLAEKRGTLIKKAPDAYGLTRDCHWTFINAYNCIYECQYCYLQGYFHSPDIVLFINYEDMMREAARLIKDSTKRLWFHSGEFADSLALAHLTDELETYFRFFSQMPKATLELRTKSVNTKKLLSFAPLSNVITAFSLSPEDKVRQYDLSTPPLQHRLKAMKKLQEHGHPLAVHFDPIIYDRDVLPKYEHLIKALDSLLGLHNISYFSLGVVRFTKDVHAQVKKNYPESDLFSSPLISDKKQLVRYPKMMRLALMNAIKKLLLKHGAKQENLYLCMER